jgi:hypothetical protein
MTCLPAHKGSWACLSGFPPSPTHLFGLVRVNSFKSTKSLSSSIVNQQPYFSHHNDAPLDFSHLFSSLLDFMYPSLGLLLTSQNYYHLLLLSPSSKFFDCVLFLPEQKSAQPIKVVSVEECPDNSSQIDHLSHLKRYRFGLFLY